MGWDALSVEQDHPQPIIRLSKYDLYPTSRSRCPPIQTVKTVNPAQNPLTMSSHSSSSTTLAPIQPSYTEPAPPPYARHNDEESPSQLSFEEEKETEEKKPYLVHWEPDDPANPLNWSTTYKSWLTFQLSMLALAASLGSSLISPAKLVIMDYTHISDEVAVLPVSFYLLGFASGPLLWAPLSEVWGRNWSMKPAMFCLGLLTIGTARSTTAASIFVTRFFGGIFGSAPVSNVSAALGDIWAPRARGIAMNVYTGAVLGGPTLGPGMQTRYSRG